MYNYLFDTEALPQIFFAHSYDNRDLIDQGGLDEKYSLRNIIRSLCLISWGNECRQYRPLEHSRTSYSLRDAETSGDYLSTEDFIYDDPKAKAEFNVRVEEFYARLSYAAMEHFMRVTNTFGLSSYRDGLEAARKVILLHNFRSKENVEPQQLYKESLARSPQGNPAAPDDIPILESKIIACTESYAELYYELIKNKIPTLQYVKALISDMKELVAPSTFRGTPDGIAQNVFSREYVYSLSTVEEVLRQFKRSVNTIERETEALRHLMERSGDRQILNELVETRKIHEFAAEDKIKVEIAPDQLQDISTKIALWRLGFGLFLFAFQSAQWLLSELANSDSYFHSYVLDDRFVITYIVSAVLIAIAFALTPYIYVSVPKLWRRKNDDEVCISIFDFANLRDRIRLQEFSKIVDDLRISLRSLFEQPDAYVPCRVHHLLSEMPTSALEKRKYSFGSAPGTNGENYTLHVEIEVHNQRGAFLTDMRLAVRVLKSEQRDILPAVESLMFKYFQ